MLHAGTKERDSRMNLFVKDGEMQFSHTVSVESVIGLGSCTKGKQCRDRNI